MPSRMLQTCNAGSMAGVEHGGEKCPYEGSASSCLPGACANLPLSSALAWALQTASTCRGGQKVLPAEPLA